VRAKPYVKELERCRMRGIIKNKKAGCRLMLSLVENELGRGKPACGDKRNL